MKVRELLDRPERWTQGVLARDTTTGNPVGPESEFATAWCLGGAVMRAYPAYEDQTEPLRRLREAIFGPPRGKGYPEPRIGNWNDAPGRTFEEVRELVERLDI